MQLFEQARSDGALLELLEGGIRSVGAEEGSLMLLDRDSLRFTICASPAAAVLVGHAQPLSRGITSLAFTFQQPMIVNDVREDPHFDATVDGLTGTPTRSMLVVPLVTPDEEFGVLSAINSAGPAGFTAADLKRFSELGVEIVARLRTLEGR